MARLELQHIGKQFPGVKALTDISLTVEAGEVHAFCGENGAGKSTLMNILSGNLQPDSGTVFLNGEAVTFTSPTAAFEHHIATVHQHLSLVEGLSVSENIFANHPPTGRWGFIRWNAWHDKTKTLLAELNIDVDPKRLVSSLSLAQKQMVEIAKALARSPQVLILDEPTASLTDVESKTLFTWIGHLKTKGVSILYISHRLPEIFALADRITVLKDGRHQGTFYNGTVSREHLITLMVGRELAAFKTESFAQPGVLLEVNDLSGETFENVSFILHRGEILGLSGLAGAGRTEIARVLCGADKKTGGIVRLNHREVHHRHPADALANGMAYLPEDRKALGLFPQQSVTENIIAASLRDMVSNGLFRASLATEKAEAYREKLHIATSGLEQKVSNLSGGNQQKTLLARYLLTHPHVLIVDEPTHGVDIGAKHEIYAHLKALSAQGIGIVMISSELPELLTLCDRIVVIRDGRLTGELNASEATEEKILALSMS